MPLGDDSAAASLPGNGSGSSVSTSPLTGSSSKQTFVSAKHATIMEPTPAASAAAVAAGQVAPGTVSSTTSKRNIDILAQMVSKRVNGPSRRTVAPSRAEAYERNKCYLDYNFAVVFKPHVGGVHELQLQVQRA